MEGEDYSQVEKEIRVTRTGTQFKVSVAFQPMADVFAAVMESLPSDTLKGAREDASKKAEEEGREATAEDITEEKRKATLRAIEADNFASKYFKQMPGILGHCLLEMKGAGKGKSWVKLGSRVEDRATKIGKSVHIIDGIHVFQFIQQYLVDFAKGLEEMEKTSDTTEAPVVIVSG